MRQAQVHASKRAIVRAVGPARVALIDRHAAAIAELDARCEQWGQLTAELVTQIAALKEALRSQRDAFNADLAGCRADVIRLRTAQEQTFWARVRAVFA